MPPNDSPSQHARFIETARALGCDEDEAAFDEKLATVARYRPAGSVSKLLPKVGGQDAGRGEKKDGPRKRKGKEPV